MNKRLSIALSVLGALALAAAAYVVLADPPDSPSESVTVQQQQGGTGGGDEAAANATSTSGGGGGASSMGSTASGPNNVDDGEFVVVRQDPTPLPEPDRQSMNPDAGSAMEIARTDQVVYQAPEGAPAPEPVKIRRPTVTMRARQNLPEE